VLGAIAAVGFSGLDLGKHGHGMAFFVLAFLLSWTAGVHAGKNLFAFGLGVGLLFCFGLVGVALNRLGPVAHDSGGLLVYDLQFTGLFLPFLPAFFFVLGRRCQGRGLQALAVAVPPMYSQSVISHAGVRGGLMQALSDFGGMFKTVVPLRDRAIPAAPVDNELVERDEQALPDALEPNQTEYIVWYGTNRLPIDVHSPDKGYSQKRASEARRGFCRIYIPMSHKVGSIGSPWWKRLMTMTDDRMKLIAIRELQGTAYAASVVERVHSAEVDTRCILIFIHGYNVSFPDAAARTAQIAFDLSMKGPVAFFGWPSLASVNGYSADMANIEWSEAAITDFMIEFAEMSKGSPVHVIGHGMGVRGVLRAVNRIATKVQGERTKPFGQIILAAADVDADVFRAASAALSEVSSRTTLYVSSRDRALEVARRLHSYPRAGLTPPVIVLPGIDTIDVTNADLTMVGHGYFAEARDLLGDIYELITNDSPPELRFGLRAERNEQGQIYWSFSPRLVPS
jgi:esterase/lipase superfamily enzyme